jgi:hypothetical protein
MTIRVSFLVPAFLLCSAVPDIAWCQTDRVEVSSDKQELLDSLETSVLAAKQFSKIDCVGDSYVSDKFFDHLANASVTRFRLQIDREAEELTWASESKPLPSDIDPDPNGLKYFFCTIVKGEVSSGDGIGVARTESFEDFENALLNSSVPIPEFWGVLFFPYSGNGSKNLELMTKIIVGPGVDVGKTFKDRQVEIALRREMPAGQPSQVSEWRFELPEMLPSKIRYSTIADGKPTEIYKQIVEFEEFKDSQRPILISGDSLIAGNDLKQVFRVGRKETTTQIGWLYPHAASGTSFKMVKKFDNATMIDKFLSDGKQQLAKPK